MNRVRKMMWQIMALVCLLMLVAGCGEKMVKGNSTSNGFSQSGERMKTYGQMSPLSSNLKDAPADWENMQMGERTINSIADESDIKPGNAAKGISGSVTEHSLLPSSAAGHGRDGTMKDGPLDIVSLGLASTPSGDGDGLRETDKFIGGRHSLNRLPQKGGNFSRGLPDVHFEFDSWRLSDQAREILADNAEWLKAHPHERVTIEGHCDERGTQSYNYVLGEKRAAMVHQYLLFLGVPFDQLHVASFGKDRPACRTMTDDCFVQNRRAHFNAGVNMVSQQPNAISR